MYACKQCGTGNSLDSGFCKKCGAALPANEIKEARAALAELIEEGNTLFTEGRTDEAILIAEAAVLADPTSNVALSLKGLCHDRLGQLAEALECYEAAVALNPDGALDKIKVAALRNRLAQHVVAAPEPNRRGAMMMASAAVVLVLVGGAFAGMAASSGHKDAGTLASNAAPQTTTTALLPPATTTSQPTTGTGAPASSIPPTTSSAPPSTDNSGTRGGSAMTVAPDNGPDLPTAGSILPNPGGYQPIKVNPPTPDPSVDPVPAPLSNMQSSAPSGGGLTTTSAAPAERKGIIDIVVAPSGGSAIPGGSQSIDDGTGVETARRAAQNAYQVHNYAEAANHYRQVADMGADSGLVQQRLGECYRNLGQSSMARTAFNRAIAEYQSQIKAGKGVDRAQLGLDSCEQALKVLGG